MDRKAGCFESRLVSNAADTSTKTSESDVRCVARFKFLRMIMIDQALADNTIPILTDFAAIVFHRVIPSDTESNTHLEFLLSLR